MAKIGTAQSNVQVLKYSHGTYVGEVLNGKAHGAGTYTAFKSGTIYAGNFINDTFSGAGTMMWTNGDRYEGVWQNDAGIKGRMIYLNGQVSNGVVRNGIFFSNTPVDSTGNASIRGGEPEKKVTDFPDGWHSLSIEDFRGTGDYEYRKKDPAKGIEVRGDIDGDGRIDKVRLMQKNDMSKCGVIATLNKVDGNLHKILLDTKGRCYFEGSDYFVTNLNQKKDIRAFQFAVGAYGKGYSRYYYERGKYIPIVESD